MKTIVISGARSGVGKTTLAREITAVLPGSQFVKIGHHPENPHKSDVYFRKGTPFAEICRRFPRAKYLVIESNAVIDEITPECLIYLPAESPKPSAFQARRAAHVVRGERIGAADLAVCARRLGITVQMMRRIAWLAGARPEAVTAIILAGGQSSRMGTNKALLTLGGTTLVARQCRQLRPYFDRIIISARSAEVRVPGVPVIADVFPGCGPLAGIHACLGASDTAMNFIVACDIPEVGFPVMFKLLSLAHGRDGAIPSFHKGTVEPLFGCYRKKTGAVIRRMLEKGSHRASDLVKTCDVHVEPFPPQSWYMNVNTPLEYRCLLNRYRRKSDRG